MSRVRKRHLAEALEPRTLLAGGVGDASRGSLAWASYLGGSGLDGSADVIIDPAGNAWMTGATSSTNFPTPGGFDTSYNGGSQDAYVAKVNANGTLAWATYLGGGAYDFGSELALDADGNVWLTGGTESADFPAQGGFDPSHNGGLDAFVAKITPGGSLAWASYFGGSDGEGGYGLDLDAAGNAFVTGHTGSSDLPTGGFDPSYNGGITDAYVAKVNADGTFAWGSYLGGSGIDPSSDLTIDSSGNAWVTGTTDSPNFPGGGFDTSYNGGHTDGYVAKIAPGGALLWGSYLGGSLGDAVYAVAPDILGNAWLAGATSSSNFPGGGFDTSYNGGSEDAIVAKVNADGTLAWGSYLGGFAHDRAGGIHIDAWGNAWVAGSTLSPNFPGGGYDPSYNQDGDSFFAKVHANGTLASGSYFGGSGSDVASDVAVDAAGNAWLVGNSSSTDLPTSGGFDPTHNGGLDDAYVAKLPDVSPPSRPDLDPSSDTGFSNTDNVTRDNTPTFSGVAPVGSTVRLRADGAEVGSAVATDGTWTITATALPDGARSMTATATSITGAVSSPSAPLVVTIDTVAPPAPSTPDLHPDSDSGISSTDNVTNDATPTLTGAAEAGSGVTLYVDGAPAGSVVAGAGQYSITTGPLANGARAVTATATDVAGNASPASAALTVTIDTDPPILGEEDVHFETAPHRIGFGASEDVSATLTTSDVQVVNLTSNFTVNTSAMSLTYDSGLNRATIAFPGLPGGILLDGRYRVSIARFDVTDVAGNPLPMPYTFEFVFLLGDATFDGRVNLSDFNRLAANFGLSNRTFSQGDFNYDGTVNLNDFNILASRFGQSVAPAAAAAAAAAAASVLSNARETPEEDLSPLV